MKHNEKDNYNYCCYNFYSNSHADFFWRILAFFDMSRLPEGTLINELESPDGTYTVKAYHVEGGTTVSDSVRGELVFNNSSKRSKNIYWNYREDSAVIKWIDDDKVVINGIGLTVPNSKYDFRNH